MLLILLRLSNTSVVKTFGSSMLGAALAALRLVGRVRGKRLGGVGRDVA